MSPEQPFSHSYEGKRVLITGHTGFKGAWLTAWLHRLGAEVHGFSLGTVSNPSLFEVLQLDSRVHHVLGDVRDAGVVKRLLHDVRPEFVFHLAAQPIVRTSVVDPVTTFSTNAMGTAHLLDGLRTIDEPCHAVLITSDKAYRNKEWEWGYREDDELGGKDPYSASKGCAELVIRAYHASYFSSPDSPVRIAAARAGNVVGGGDWAEDRIVPDCVRAWSRGVPVEVRNPNATRPWQHVLEPLSGYLALGGALAAGEPVAGESFNFGPASEVTAPVLQLIEGLADRWSFDGHRERIRVLPTRDALEAGLLKLNCDKALARLRWRPTLDLANTVRFTMAWYDAFYLQPEPSMFDLTLTQVDEYVALARTKGMEWVGTAPTN